MPRRSKIEGTQAGTENRLLQTEEQRRKKIVNAIEGKVKEEEAKDEEA